MACVNNLRQQAIAFLIWVDDLGGRFPKRDETCGWQNAYGGNTGVENVWSPPAVGTTPASSRPLNRYVDNNYELFHCPSDVGGFLGVQSDTLYKAIGNSYVYNMIYGVPNVGDQPMLEGKNLSEVKEPSKTIMIGDWPMHAFWSMLDPYNAHSRWHDKSKVTANVAFVDGHIKYITLTDWNSGDGLAGDGWKLRSD